ncbi:hypothetical protein [Piscinibacter sakaiensis]|uniref:hypothetical protein n=1 Tax=Piscinibacter sakaiensis TaxID=1547922 RepID=UPI003AABEB06
MFSNAVSSAVGRLYAGTAIAEPTRQQPVRPVEPVVRAEQSTPGAPSDDGRGDAKAQRQALADGVRAVFESTVGTEADAATPDIDDPLRRLEGGDDEAAAAEPLAPADPQLEEAILRFIHAVFRTLAETEGGPMDNSSVRGETGAPAQRQQLPGVSASREQLGRRIGSFAERLAAAGPAGDPLHSADRHGDLGKAFTAVRQALGGHQEPATAARPTRGDLVMLMQRLAHAMQGSPPLDEGLPTVGGLLHARA